jgi:Protein of unknown function (DUF1150)
MAEISHVLTPTSIEAGNAFESASLRGSRKRPPYPVCAEQFRCIGIGQLVYMKTAMDGDEQVFMIYAADGTLLEVADSVDDAMLSVVENNVSCVSLH